MKKIKKLNLKEETFLTREICHFIAGIHNENIFYIDYFN